MEVCWGGAVYDLAAHPNKYIKCYSGAPRCRTESQSLCSCAADGRH